jgi:hypothetical protein
MQFFGLIEDGVVNRALRVLTEGRMRQVYASAGPGPKLG